MKLIAYTWLVCLLTLSCITDDFKKHATFIFEIDNTDPNNFGYEEISDGPNFAVSSMALGGGYVFMMDKFHGNIKRVDIESGEVKTSKRLEIQRNPLLSDIIYFNNRIIILTELDVLYMMDLELHLIEQVNIKRGDKYFIRKDESKFDICNINTYEVETYNNELKLIGTKKWDGKGVFGKVNLLQDYSFETLDNNNTIRTEFGSVFLDGSFPGDDLDYEARCFTFNQN